MAYIYKPRASFLLCCPGSRAVSPEQVDYRWPFPRAIFFLISSPESHLDILLVYFGSLFLKLCVFHSSIWLVQVYFQSYPINLDYKNFPPKPGPQNLNQICKFILQSVLGIDGWLLFLPHTKSNVFIDLSGLLF